MTLSRIFRYDQDLVSTLMEIQVCLSRFYGAQNTTESKRTIQYEVNDILNMAYLKGYCSVHLYADVVGEYSDIQVKLYYIADRKVYVKEGEL